MTSQQTSQTYPTFPRGIGAMLNGWQYGPHSVLDFRAMTEKCAHNCAHCFTNKRKKDLSFTDIKRVIEQAKDIGFRAINYLGEGEPTIDNDFWDIIEYTSKLGIIPVVFTDAATTMSPQDPSDPFRRIELSLDRLLASGASVCPKCDSLFNEDYQNQVVGDRTERYFQRRNEALEWLIMKGFNKFREDGTTRLGFDMVVTKRNIREVKKTLEYCRQNNLWVVFSSYLPAGRCAMANFDKSLAPVEEELAKMRKTIQRVDAKYGFNHPIYNNFGTMPCVEFIQIYGNGDVSPCPGNETIVGNVKTKSLASLADKIKNQFPGHRKENYDGNCPYRR